MPVWPSRIREQFRSVWNSHTSPRKIAFALALGVFWGSSPFWGLHTLLVIGCCFLFSLNKPAALLGSLISNPVLAPFLIFFSLEAGSSLLYGRAAHLSLAEVRHHFQSPGFRDILNEYLLPYFVGSLIVGLALAAITFWVSLWIARSYRGVNQRTGGSPGRCSPEGP